MGGAVGLLGAGLRTVPIKYFEEKGESSVDEIHVDSASVNFWTVN